MPVHVRSPSFSVRPVVRLGVLTSLERGPDAADRGRYRDHERSRALGAQERQQRESKIIVLHAKWLFAQPEEWRRTVPIAVRRGCPQRQKR